MQTTMSYDMQSQYNNLAQQKTVPARRVLDLETAQAIADIILRGMPELIVPDDDHLWGNTRRAMIYGIHGNQNYISLKGDTDGSIQEAVKIFQNVLSELDQSILEGKKEHLASQARTANIARMTHHDETGQPDLQLEAQHAEALAAYEAIAEQLMHEPG